MVIGYYVTRQEYNILNYYFSGFCTIKCTHDILSFSGIFRLESSLAPKYFMMHRCNVREWEWEGMGKAVRIHGNGNWLQNWEWEWEGMGIDCTGMGGSGNVKSHSRASLLRINKNNTECKCNKTQIWRLVQIWVTSKTINY